MLLITVILLLVTATTTNAIFLYINSVYHKLGCDYTDTPEQFDMTKYIWAVIGNALSAAVSSGTVSVSQWLFAESYWTLGFKIEKNISSEQNGEKLARIRRFGKVFMALILADSVLMVTFFLLFKLKFGESLLVIVVYYVLA